MEYILKKVTAKQIIPENLLLHNIQKTNVISTEIDPTDFCNYKCSWCFTHKNRSRFQIEIEYLKKYIDNFLLNGGRSIHFSGGGEPLLFKELFEQTPVFENQSIINYCLKKNIAIGIITNGLYLNKLFGKVNISKLAFVRISMDAVSSSSYSLIHKCGVDNFDRVIENIKHLVELRKSFVPALGLSFIVDKNMELNYSMQDIIKISELAKSLKVDFVQFKHLHTTNEIEAEIEMNDMHTNCCKINWGDVEFWIHHYIAPKRKGTCNITKFIEVLAAKQIISPCCHLFGVKKTTKIICSSKVCRYDSMNKLLNLIEFNNENKLSKEKLYKSIKEYGFHPYRLFPSAPDLFFPFRSEQT